MQPKRIVLYPGDGIGPEVLAVARDVLAALEHCEPAARFSFTEVDWGVRHWEQTGEVAPADFLAQLRNCDAILLGAVGWPALLPDHVTLAPLVKIRQAFDQYACVRPAKLLSGVRSPLAGKGPAEIDFVVVRENSEGEYLDCGSRVRVGEPDEFALQTAVHTRRGVQRILRFAFELAARRRGRLVMTTKSNAQRYAYTLWDELLVEVGREFPHVAAERQHADALAMNLVRRPESFDVIVASNLFGDLLTDLAGVISGGLGLAPSTNTNPERMFPSMFEPVHGSAPDIAGQGIANPMAAVLSAALMLDWLALPAAAQRVRTAVEQTLKDGFATPDLGGRQTTAEIGLALVERLSAG